MKKYNNLIYKLYEKGNEYYFNEFKNYNEDFDFWEKVIKKYKPNNILEVGTGNGRLCKLILDNAKNYDIIDFSTEICEKVKTNFPYISNIFCEDFKLFNNRKKYDLIIFPFNVINNFYSINDIEKMFSTIKNISNTNTVIIFDTFNPNGYDLIDSKDYEYSRNFELNDKIIKVYEKKEFDIINSICIYKKRYLIDDNIVYSSILPNRVFFHQELKLILKFYGYDIINLYGDYDFSVFNYKSRKQLYILRRKK